MLLGLFEEEEVGWAWHCLGEKKEWGREVRGYSLEEEDKEEEAAAAGVLFE